MLRCHWSELGCVVKNMVLCRSPEKTPIEFLKNLNQRTLSSWSKNERSKMLPLKIDEKAFGQKQGMLGVVSEEGSSHTTKGEEQRPGKA